MARSWTICCVYGIALFAAGREEQLDRARALLKNRVEEAHRSIGMVAGMIDESGRGIVGAGRLARVTPQQPNGDTVFEIGSITKVFTSLLLADMIERGEVKGDDPVSRYLPVSVKMPAHHGHEITLLSLSMQVSGLPRLPNNLHPSDWTNPYADYGVAQLYEFLSGHTLRRDPGEHYEYSNLGAGLLGHALALRAGLSYEELLRNRILEPLGMRDTSIALSDGQRRRLAIGHDARRRPVNNWDIPTLAGAGALRSTANDLLKFLAAHLELVDTPLAPAMRRMRQVRHATGIADLEVAMGWHVLTRYGIELIWHNGGTGGYRSFIGFVPSTKKAVVVLSNTVMDTDEIGRHLLEEKYPAPLLPAMRLH